MPEHQDLRAGLERLVAALHQVLAERVDLSARQQLLHHAERHVVPLRGGGIR